MLYKFKSRATADLIMLEPNGRQVLQIIGKGDEPHGIITVEQIPAAIDALQRAVAEEEARIAEARRAARQGREGDAAAPEEDGEHAGAQDRVSLRQRAAPFIDMLRRSAAEEADVIW